MIRLEELRYILVPLQGDARHSNKIINEAYRCWKTVWSDTFKELDGLQNIFSDDFKRQSYLGCLFQGERCLALGFFNELDFRQTLSQDDSYFKVWPADAIHKLLEDGPKVMVGSNITVDPDFRGDLGSNLQLKNVLIGLMVKTFLVSDLDVMTGTMRVNKNMHQAAFKFGATPLNTKALHHGVEVELVAFYRRRLLEQSNPSMDFSTNFLWRSRLDYRQNNFNAYSLEGVRS